MLCPQCSRDNPSDARFCMSCATGLPVPDAPSADPVTDIALSRDFVGRRREMGELAAALEDVLSGRGRLMMLGGEPGIGKTRTAEEFAAYAQEQNARVLWGRCHEQPGMPPFWPWIQAIRSYVREREPEQLRSDMGNGAAIIAEIVSDINELLPGLVRPPDLDSPEQAQFRLFDAITTFLKDVSAQSNALTLILDNLHWSDKPSLLLLEFLSQELSDSHLMVIGTYRDVDLSRQHSLAETLGELTRARLFQRVPLRGLSLEDEGQLIQVTSGSRPSQEFVELVHSRTEGNPLFVVEVLRMLEQEGGVAQDDADIRIPEGVREVIGRRLNRLTDQCNRALTVASVIGRGFEFTQLLRLVEGVSEDSLLESLEEALSARMIEETPQSVGRYQFTHALIQQTLMDELSTTRRVRLSVRIIDMFEELYGEDIEARAAELAYHAAEAEAIIGPDKLLHYSIMAGERDLDSYALEDALPHFQRALDAREDLTMDDQLATIKFGIGRAMAPIVRSPHEAQLAWDASSQAFDYYVEQGDIEKAIDVAVHPIAVAFVTGVADLLARALELVPRESIQAGYLLSRLSGALIYELADIEGGLNAAMESITIARRENDEVLEARSLANLVTPLRLDHRPHEAIEAGLIAAEIAQRIGDLQSEQRAQWVLAQALLTVGLPDRAQIHADAASQASEKLHDRNFQAQALLASAYRATYQEDWSEAKDLADQILEIMPQNGWMLGFKGWISLQSNDAEAARHLIDDVSSVSDTAINISAWLVRIAYETNDTDYVDMGQAALISGEPANAFQSFWIGHFAAVVAVLRKDAVAAAEHYPALARDKGTVLYPAIFSADHILGLLARTMGDLDAARTHFDDAITFCRKANYRPELAWTCHDYADMIIQSNGSGDPSKVRELVDEADQIALSLSMMPLEEKLVALREQLDGRPSPKPEFPDGLTEREVEVLRLIAAGRTDREIAESLFISFRTVGNHVGNILNKTTTTNRTEAAAYAARQGLV